MIYNAGVLEITPSELKPLLQREFDRLENRKNKTQEELSPDEELKSLMWGQIVLRITEKGTPIEEVTDEEVLEAWCETHNWVVEKLSAIRLKNKKEGKQ